MYFSKADFTEIYNHTTPSLYINTLSVLNYRNPDFVPEALIDMVNKILFHRGKCTILDLASSYGFNGAIVKYNLPFGPLSFGVNLPQPVRNCTVIGLDVSWRATRFARTNGYIDIEINQNLEQEVLDKDKRGDLRGVDLIVASGAFSYIGKKTFRQILSYLDTAPEFLGWPTFACDIEDIKEEFLQYGISLIADLKPCPMRDFISRNEKESYFSKLNSTSLNIDNHAENKLCVYKIQSF